VGLSAQYGFKETGRFHHLPSGVNQPAVADRYVDVTVALDTRQMMYVNLHVGLLYH
jgi:hypothetical protein